MNPRVLLAVGVVLVALAAGAYFGLRHRVLPVAGSSAVVPAVVAVPVSVDCLLPGPPPVPPNGAVASEADMRLGHDAIQGFVLELEAYQACENRRIDHAGPGVSAQQKQRWIDQGNAAIDEANALASAFATQLAAHKARSAP